MVEIRPAYSLAAPKSRLVTINASSVKPKNIDFIWPGRLSQGQAHCFAGEGASVRASYSSP
jgi:hypothetical protein